MNANNRQSPRTIVSEVIKQGVKDKLPRGELCINDSLVRQALNCGQVGFAERLAFVDALCLDLFTISPVYPERKNRLPEAGEVLWPDLERWTNQTGLFTFAILDGAFEWGLRLFGFQEFLLWPRTNPHELRRFIQKVESLNLAMLRMLADQGIGGILLADDIAFASGLMIRPATLREFFFPSLARQVEEAKKCNRPAFYHSDGNYRAVLPDIIQAGFAGLHCIDHNSGMDITRLQSEVGEALCLWGHLDLNDLEKAAEPDQLEELLISIRKLALNHKLILGTNSGLFEGMNLAGLKALYGRLAALSGRSFP